MVLNLLDIVTTRLAIARGGAEGNPLAGLFVDNLTLFVAIKVFVPGLVAWRMWSIRSRITPLLLAAMWHADRLSALVGKNTMAVINKIVMILLAAIAVSLIRQGIVSIVQELRPQ